MPEAQAAFQAAVERLPFSKDLATAYFRLADAQFQQTNFAGAIKNYQAIIEKFGALPEVRTNLFEPALYQTVRAGVAGGNLAAATNALQQLRAGYPKQLECRRAVLLTGQEISRRGDPAGARAMLLEFARSAPDAPLLPELQLAVAATYEQEKKWTEAIAQYDSWLASFPTPRCPAARGVLSRLGHRRGRPRDECADSSSPTSLSSSRPTSSPRGRNCGWPIITTPRATPSRRSGTTNCSFRAPIGRPPS